MGGNCVPCSSVFHKVILVLFFTGGAFRSVSGLRMYMILLERVVVVVILWNRNNISCSMFHSFRKYIYGSWRCVALQTCGVPRTVWHCQIRTYLETVEHWNKPHFSLVHQWLACSTTLEHVWNKSGTFWHRQRIALTMSLAIHLVLTLQPCPSS